METMLDIVRQENIELRFNRKHIDAKIRNELLESEECLAKIEAAETAINTWMNKNYYESKNKRLAQLKGMNIKELIMDILVCIAYCVRPELFTAVSGQIAMRLDFSETKSSLTTVGEMVAIICETDLYDIKKESRQAQLMVVSRMPLSDKLIAFIEGSKVLPPMVCEPLPLEHNFSSGYLTHNESLVLGQGNHHDGDLCLDVLNTLGRVALKLDTEFLSKVEEQPTFELDSQDKIDDWIAFKKSSYLFYIMMVDNGNRFYLNHQVDKRGRIYAQGYYITTQGTAFKKAMIEFHNEQLVQGVPNESSN